VVQTLLFVAGINTLIQSFLGTRLPAVMGGSYTFVAPTISIILAGRYSGIADPHEVPASSSNFQRTLPAWLTD
jgi:xanthine/uracil permease